MFYIVVSMPILAYGAMAMYPFIFVKRYEYRYDVTLMNHEKIHLRQQLEMLLIPFYIAYLLNYLWNLAYYRNHHQAYMNICFEREAYDNEMDLNYLKSRSFWRFLNYLNSKN
jgi:hypothetical protein